MPRPAQRPARKGLHTNSSTHPVSVIFTALHADQQLRRGAGTKCARVCFAQEFRVSLEACHLAGHISRGVGWGHRLVGGIDLRAKDSAPIG